jgi:hypothetical protein
MVIALSVVVSVVREMRAHSLLFSFEESSSRVSVFNVNSPLLTSNVVSLVLMSIFITDSVLPVNESFFVLMSKEDERGMSPMPRVIGVRVVVGGEGSIRPFRKERVLHGRPLGRGLPQARWSMPMEILTEKEEKEEGMKED